MLAAWLLLGVTGLHRSDLPQFLHLKAMRVVENFGRNPVTANTAWKGWEPLTQFYVCPDNYPQEKFTQRTSSLFLNLELLWKTIKKKKKVEQSGISFPDTLKNNHCFPSSCAAKSRCESYQALAWSDRSHVNIKAKSHQNQHSPCLQTDLRLQQCQQPTASAKIFAVVASCPCSPKSVSQVRKIREILSYESQNYLSSGKI